MFDKKNVQSKTQFISIQHTAHLLLHILRAHMKKKQVNWLPYQHRLDHNYV